MEGEWVSDDLTSMIRLMIRNLDRFSNLEKGWARLKNVWYFLQHLRRKNSVEGSRQNIHEHYDLGNDFYQLFLDPTMNYSSGIFESPTGDNETRAEMTLASIRKMDQVCRKLQLKPGESVLEIGTGWGGLAIHMAKHFGCRVTTTTISQEQHRLAVERVKQEGLEDRVDVLLKDYRNLTGKYDKIVSIEMIEAVGHQFYDEYFAQCSDLLHDDGAMLLQSITMGENDFDYHIRHVDFIRKYVFPGGCLPCVSALTQSVGRVSDMRMLYQEDITPHYVRTLRFWRSQFMSKLDEVRAMGYPDAFIRLWHFYLCYCEAAFAERRVHNIHLMFAKPKCPIDPAVDFADEERGLRGELSEELILATR
jgi:cyclopropane-fatty-acyl-phospholipid synthase